LHLSYKYTCKPKNLGLYFGWGYPPKKWKVGKKMVNMAIGLSPEELNFLFTLSDLKEMAKELKIQNCSKMNKIVLCLNIESALESGVNQ